jgi:hypothetical protein
MKGNQQRHNWFVDAALTAGFLAALWLDLTGVAAHQWLGVTVAALAGYHLWKHWNWVKAVTPRFPARTSRQVRTLYLVDAALAAGIAAIALTGVVISTWLNLSLADYASWRAVHVAVSVASLGLLVAKVALHWRWIIGVARRSVFPAATPLPAQLQPVPVAAQVGRRDFVRLIGGVGVVALATGYNVLAGEVVDASPSAAAGNNVLSSVATDASTSVAAGQGTQATISQTTISQTTASSQTQAAAAPVQSSTACTVLCSRGCSYPGRCGRYIDTNGNGKCDRGECMA